MVVSDAVQSATDVQYCALYPGEEVLEHSVASENGRLNVVNVLEEVCIFK